jgi:Flp pilus assembly protein TadG
MSAAKVFARQGSNMALRRTSTVSFAKAVRDFGGDRKGSAAVQFALIGLPFFMMLFAIIETALMFFAQQALETAAQDAARLIFTGQAQSSNYDQTQFKQALCARLDSMFDCTNGVYINVQNSSSFGGLTPVTPIDPSGQFVNNFSYSPGSSGSIVLVQAFYLWPLFVTGLGYNPANVNGHYRLLAASAAFRNEPF